MPERALQRFEDDDDIIFTIGYSLLKLANDGISFAREAFEKALASHKNKPSLREAKDIFEKQ